MSHAVPISECPDPSVHGHPLRYCPYCEWREEPAPKTSITIPWPPSDELVERVTTDVREVFANPAYYRDPAYAVVRAVLDVIGGAADER